MIHASFFLNIIILNFIIALMSESHAAVRESSAVYSYKQTVELIRAHMNIVDIKKTFQNKRYIMIVQPEQTAIEEIDQAETRVGQLRDGVENAVESLRYITDKIKHS